MPKQPQADLIKWAFEQFATGTYSINQVRIMTLQKGKRLLPLPFLPTIIVKIFP